MAEQLAYSLAKHPAPHRDRVGLTALFYGLFAAPIIWAGNFMVDYGLASYACYPGGHPLQNAQPGLGFVYWLTLAFYLLTLCVCLSGFAVSYRNWRITGSEADGHHHDLMEKGEGRTRYLSIIGMAFGALFFVATLAGLLIYFFVPLCGYQ
jgi:hypothetical protein